MTTPAKKGWAGLDSEAQASQVAIGRIQRVRTSMIQDAAITEPKLANLAISLAKLAPNSVDASKIVDGSIGGAEMASNNLAVRIVTSTTRPSHIAGQLIYETDTTRILMSNGTAWIRVGQLGDTGRTGVSLRRAAAQSVPSNVETNITWDTEDTDTDSFITTPGTNIVIPTGLGGLYGIAAQAILNVTSSRQFLAISVAGINYRLIMNETDEQVGGGLVIPIAAGATVICRVYTLSGGATFTARLHMYRVGG